MSTRETQNSSHNVPSSDDINTYVELPSCAIEDIDRSLFNLFDKELPLTYTHLKKSQRVPVVFASGERFAIIARKKPLRDKSNALILPVISIMRTELVANNEMGLSSNQAVPHVVKTKLSKKDIRYQRLLNKLDLKNADYLPSTNSFLDAVSKSGTDDNRIATRRTSTSFKGVQKGSIFNKDLMNNIYDVYEIPPAQFITATYEITIWAQYVQQMNEIVMTILSNSHDYSQRTFRIETSKGYKFVAYLDESFAVGNNFEDFTDDERIIRTTFNVKVPGYILGKTYDGSQSRIKVTTSAPQITFEIDLINGEIEESKTSNIVSGDPKDFITDDDHVNLPLPGQSIGGASRLTNSDESAIIAGTSNTDGGRNASKGGSGTPQRIYITKNDPFSDSNKTYVKTRTSRNGESIYREII
jgi:hypothetical protein